MGTGFDLWNFDFIKAELKKIFGNYRNYNKYLKEKKMNGTNIFVICIIWDL